MIQFNCNGKFLDIYEGFSPSLKRKNNAFSFGSLELGRSLSFDVPTTPNNNVIFENAKDYHRNGAKARVQIATQMQYSGGVCDGMLYISNTTASKYSCVFVFGDLYALKVLRDAGKIADALSYQDTTKVLPRKPANGADALARWASIDYRNNNVYGIPSVNLSMLFDSVQMMYGVRVDFTNDMKRVRVIPGELNTPTFGTYLSKNIEYYEITDLDGHGIIEPHLLERVDEYKHVIINGVDVIQGDDVRDPYTAADFSVVYGVDSVTIKFGVDFPDNIFVCRYRTPQDVTFYGDRSFNIALSHSGATASIVGKPLAGREITINRADENGRLNYFSFYDINKWHNEGVGSAYNAGFIDWDDCRPVDNENTKAFQFYVNIESKTQGDISDIIDYRLQDNMPDLSFIDVINIMCMLFGKRVTANGNIIGFDDVNVHQWPIIDLDKIISEGTMERTFLDWSQNNVVAFDSDESVFNSMKIRQTYTIDNVNIERESELYTIPFSEGNRGYDGDIEIVSVADILTYRNEQGEDVTEIVADKPTIALTGSVAQMERVSIDKVNSYQALCDASTKTEITCVLPLFEFVNLPENCRLWHNGALWIWTEASYRKGITTITLQRL